MKTVSAVYMPSLFRSGGTIPKLAIFRWNDANKQRTEDRNRTVSILSIFPLQEAPPSGNAISIASRKSPASAQRFLICYVFPLPSYRSANFFHSETKTKSTSRGRSLTTTATTSVFPSGVSCYPAADTSDPMVLQPKKLHYFCLMSLKVR